MVYFLVRCVMQDHCYCLESTVTGRYMTLVSKENDLGIFRFWQNDVKKIVAE